MDKHGRFRPFIPQKNGVAFRDSIAVKACRATRFDALLEAPSVTFWTNTKLEKLCRNRHVMDLTDLADASMNVLSSMGPQTISLSIKNAKDNKFL